MRMKKRDGQVMEHQFPTNADEVSDMLATGLIEEFP
jgi:hypothetical protein